VLWTVIALAGWVAAIINDGGGGAGGLIILGWVGAIATALVIRPAYTSEPPPRSPASARPPTSGWPSAARASG